MSDLKLQDVYAVADHGSLDGLASFSRKSIGWGRSTPIRQSDLWPMTRAAITWVGGDSQMFVGRDSFGHVVVSGSWPRHEDDGWTEWKAIKPSDLLLLSLASCSAHDVVSILRKQRQRLEELLVTVDAKQADAPPFAFEKLHLHYRARGLGLDPSKVERAAELSETKYCSVAATVRGVAKLSHSVEVVEAG